MKRGGNHGSYFTPPKPKHVVRTCKRCGEPFASLMVTKGRNYCDTCRPIAEEEARVAQNVKRSARKKAQRAAGLLPPRDKRKRKRLIPYAGYDPTERSPWNQVRTGDEHEHTAKDQ